MSSHSAKIEWKRQGDFQYKVYSRDYDVQFGGGSRIQASNPKEYFGRDELPNPEELLVSAVSGCYMQNFLAYASIQGFVVESYTDDAEGKGGKNESGKPYLSDIYLNPKITASKGGSEKEWEDIRVKALENCMISNSVRSQVHVELTLVP